MALHVVCVRARADPCQWTDNQGFYFDLTPLKLATGDSYQALAIDVASGDKVQFFLNVCGLDYSSTYCQVDSGTICAFDETLKGRALIWLRRSLHEPSVCLLQTIAARLRRLVRPTPLSRTLTHLLPSSAFS